MEMYSNKIKVLSKVVELIDKKMLEPYGDVEGEDDFVKVELNIDNNLEKVVRILEKVKPNDIPGIFVVQKHRIEDKDMEWRPLIANFLTEDFDLCEATFFMKKNGTTYRVELDFDFEDSWIVEISSFTDSQQVKSFVVDNSDILNDFVQSMKQQEEV